jgi:hypothetical protein
LSVEHSGTDLLLTWNRDAAAIRSASHATLTINDGERHENYEMDLAQLRTGSIVYSPLGGDVSFQIEVVAKDNSKIITEPLRLLRTRPSPMPDGQDTKAAKNTNPAQPAPNAPNPQNQQPAPADTKESEAATAEQPKQQAPVKPFDASSLSGRLRPARAAELADAPSPSGALVAPKVNAHGSLPFASLPYAPAPPPAATPATLAAARTTAPNTAKSNNASSSGGQIQAAQLISRKNRGIRCSLARWERRARSN